MDTFDLYNRFVSTLANTNDIDELITLVNEFKQHGGSQKTAQSVLNNLLDGRFNEHTEDAIRDTLDLIVGWCHSSVAIWPYKP